MGYIKNIYLIWNYLDEDRFQYFDAIIILEIHNLIDE